MNKQVQLSKRLQAVVSLVTKGESVADVGCDHAYISIYMLQEGIATHVIAMDINRGPLERANINISKYGYSHEIETRLSNGIKELKPGEVHTLLIAGMGGPLMQQILQGNDQVMQQVGELVLQPQSEIGEFRKFVESIGFEIVEENMVFEDGKYYPMMRARKTEQVNSFQREVYYRYGKYLLESKNECLYNYLKKELSVSEGIQKKLESHSSKSGEEKLKTVKEDITYCKEALAFYEDATNDRDS